MRKLNVIYWGISIALSWLWGLGLFFSVQFSVQFGFIGLLTFAIPNAIGLFLFGYYTQKISKKLKDGDSLEAYFEKWSKPLKGVLVLYQLTTVTLTLFAIIKYFFIPLGLANTQILMPMFIFFIVAVAVLLGSYFGIAKIKYSHSVLFLFLLLSVAYIFLTVDIKSISYVADKSLLKNNGVGLTGYIMPIIIGFLAGPWLDIQQWQRAVQIQKEKSSIVNSYSIGSVIFLMLIVFHGSLAIWASEKGALHFASIGQDGFLYAHNIITSFFTHNHLIAYGIFIFISIITTLDSGYIALSWFYKKHSAQQQHVLYAMIPKNLATSPVPLFIVAAVITIITIHLNFELIYFIVLYGSFFIGFASLGVYTAFSKNPKYEISNSILYLIGIISVIISGFGYFLSIPGVLTLGSVLPVLLFILLKQPVRNIEVVNNNKAEGLLSKDLAPKAAVITDNATILAQHDLASEYFEGPWYVYNFKATYCDTNSVGNVYFAQYAMWVGKTRELYFNAMIPGFDLKTTPYYILTRSFEHKFMREAKEFDTITVKIKMKDYNRKFGTLEHKIYNGNTLLGSGTQGLLFVSSKDYKQIDVPQELVTAVLKHHQ